MQTNYFTQLKDFFICIVKPSKLLENNYSNLTFSSKIWAFIKIFLSAEFITFFIAILQIIFTLIISALFKYDVEKNSSFGDFFNFSNNSNQNLFALIITLIILGLLTVIFAPIIEELIFRLHLKFKKIYLAVSLGLFFGYFIIGNIITKVIDVNSQFLKLILALGLIVVTTLLLTLIFYVILKYTKLGKIAEKIYKNKFWIPFYVSILVFGMIHIANFQNKPAGFILFTPLLTLTQLWLGYVLGFIRIRFGIGYSILTHMIHNFVTVALVLFLVFLASSLNPNLF